MKKTLFSALFACVLMANAQNYPVLEHVSTYHSGIFDDGAAEISAFDPTTKKLVFVNAHQGTLDILDLSNIQNPTKIDSISLSSYGAGANSVVIKNGKIIAAVENSDKQENGKVVFFDMNGTFEKEITVGALPDMVTVTPDGKKVIVACEGEPNDDYSKNPNGTIHIIDISGGIASAVSQEINFANFETIRNSFDGQGDWDYALNPTTYNDQDTNVILYGDVWGVINKFNKTNNEIKPVQGDSIFGLLDLDNPNHDGWHTITFDTKDISSKVSGGHVSFYHNAIGYDGTDSIGYILNFNNGTDWEMSNYVALNKNTDAWQRTNIAIPAGTSHVRLRLMAKQNGGSDFAAFDKVELRFIDDRINVFEDKVSHTVQSELEPEYITVDKNSEYAYVVFQENNAMAKIKLADNSISMLKSLGFKDHNAAGNGLDGSDKDGAINISNYPIMGMYQPDAIASFEISGTTYIATANEGDGKEYDEYEDESKISKMDLDTIAFPNAASLQEDEKIGRMKATVSMGDSNYDGQYETLYTYGARSFSIFDENLNLVYDSGDDFAQTIKDSLPSYFNADNDDNDSFDKRSDNKGTEPEAVTIGVVDGKTYAFIGLERIGGVMIYDVSNPSSPEFVQYLNNRNFSVDAESAQAKDLAPEGILFIPASESPANKNLLITSNEVSGTISIFTFETLGIGVEELNKKEDIFIHNNELVFSKAYSGLINIFDINGKLVSSSTVNESNIVELPTLSKGTYLIQTENKSIKFVK